MDRHQLLERKADGERRMRDTLGGKGAGLAEMTNAGLPVPPGFTISTDVCSLYYAMNGKMPSAIETEIAGNIRKLEKAAGATLTIIPEEFALNEVRPV